MLCHACSSCSRSLNTPNCSSDDFVKAVQRTYSNAVSCLHLALQVLIRIRPLSSTESVQGFGKCVRQENAHTISWLGQPESRFTFDHVAGEMISQEELFQVAGLPMVTNCMAGYNSCMFAYGQTGSGKTHTMLGDIGDLDHQPSDNRGMTPRVFECLFAQIRMAEEARKCENLRYMCKCSFLEIYNEQITDLLDPSSVNLQLREDINKGVYVENLTEVEVQSVQDVVQLLLVGAANRRVAATNMNRESSRSHSVFTCIIQSQWECDSMINFRFGRLNLVDLAGSERQKSSGAEGDRLKEAVSINKSLSTLGLVIMVLVDIANGKQRHVPYRDSKLSFLLQDSLGGNSKTTIIANISPSSCSSLETLSTLRFAQRAKFIQNNVQPLHDLVISYLLKGIYFILDHLISIMAELA
jgi:kinesin family protein 15